MREPRGLGRGLSALMGEPAPTASAPTAESGEGLRKIAIGNLRPGKYQPRTHFNEEELESLSQSLQHSGMMQPIVVRPHKSEDGVFEIVAGERRWRAAPSPACGRPAPLAWGLGPFAGPGEGIARTVRATAAVAVGPVTDIYLQAHVVVYNVSVSSRQVSKTHTGKA